MLEPDTSDVGQNPMFGVAADVKESPKAASRCPARRAAELAPHCGSVRGTGMDPITGRRTLDEWQ